MSIILRIGLASVWVVIVAANFEYSVKSISPMYKKIQENDDEKPDFELVNANVKVRQYRADPHLYSGHELCFIALAKRLERQLNHPRPRVTPECNGTPGLWLKNPSKQSVSPNIPFLLPTETLPPKMFCYTAMTFEITRDRDNSVMKLRALFQSEDDKKTLMIILSVFTPPVKEADIRHAAENDVLRNVCPIPLDQFETEGLIPRMKGQEAEQYFVGDMGWLKEVLPRARRLEGKNEWYYAGPVIILPELYKQIIGLDETFSLHASGQEPKPR